MKIFFDLLPIILFFASYKWAGSNAEQAMQWLNHYLGFAVSGGSVGLTEAFMQAAKAGEDYDLIDPKSKKPAGTLRKSV